MAEPPPARPSVAQAAAIAPAACGHGHLVALYESDAFLADTVATFLADGLAGADAAIVIATAPHRAAFDAALIRHGVDPVAARISGRLTVLDASDTLARFMEPGGPHAGRFRETITAAMDSVGDRPIRAYGEMVSVLWERGDIGAALALEDLWNDLAADRAFTLLCAYPMAAFEDPGSADAFARMCSQHGTVIPAEGYATVRQADDEGLRRAVALLQRELAVLRRQLADRRPDLPALAGSAPGRPAGPPHRRAADATADELAIGFTAALRDGDARRATELLDEGVASGIAPPVLLARVVAPAMHRVGTLWESGTLSVVDEQIATVTCQRAIAGLYPAILTSRPRSRERVVVAGVHGESHGLAPRIVADVLEGLGFDVVHLGSNVPSPDLVASVARFEPELVALSVTLPRNEAALERAIAAIQREHPGMLFLLGGQGVSQDWADRGFAVARSVEDAGRLAVDMLRERPAMPDLSHVAAVPPTAAPEREHGDEFVAVAGDLGELARKHALRAHGYRLLALEDPLTGLPNRRAFDDRFEEAVASDERMVMLVVDVDDFKAINDIHGHEAGDELLAEVARALREELRPGDLVARLGGDEFGALLTHGEVDAEALAHRLRTTVESRCLRLGATISVGGAVFGGDRRLTALDADRALYAAKAHGRNAVAFARPGEPARVA